MTIVGGFDVHRAQITFDYLDTETGELCVGQIRPASALRGCQVRAAPRLARPGLLRGGAGQSRRKASRSPASWRGAVTTPFASAETRRGLLSNSAASSARRPDEMTGACPRPDQLMIAADSRYFPVAANLDGRPGENERPPTIAGLTPSTITSPGFRPSTQIRQGDAAHLSSRSFGMGRTRT